VIGQKIVGEAKWRQRPDVMAKQAGFKSERYESNQDIKEKYFQSRTDGLIPRSGECFLVAMV
jgi:hypothetical protein